MDLDRSIFFCFDERVIGTKKSSEGQTSTRLSGNKLIRYYSRSFLDDKLFLKIILLIVRLSINVKMCCKMKIKHNLPLIFVPTMNHHVNSFENESKAVTPICSINTHNQLISTCEIYQYMYIDLIHLCVKTSRFTSVFYRWTFYSLEGG